MKNIELNKVLESVQQGVDLYSEQLPNIDLCIEGKLTRVAGLTYEAKGISLPVGSLCRLKSLRNSNVDALAEVIGFSDNTIMLMPIENANGLMLGDRVIPLNQNLTIKCSEDMLGRVINGVGLPLDGGLPFNNSTEMPLEHNSHNPLERKAIEDPLDVGVKAINGLLTVGKGQRMGLFAGSGVGKSVLLGMMTRFTKADVVVVGLIGERGREVSEFINNTLGPEGMKKAVIIASPADDPPLIRMKSALTATTVAEYFCQKGADVLLIVDSLTRYAQAQREVYLGLGELPANKGYTPSVFTSIPKLVERAGNLANRGSLTGFYSVLAEGDDMQDPIVDAARAILDGHILLSRDLADMGHYPAIDISTSVSRLMPNLLDKQCFELVQVFKRLYSVYRENSDLITVGAYEPGGNKELDVAVQLIDRMKSLLRQSTDESYDLNYVFNELLSLMSAT